MIVKCFVLGDFGTNCYGIVGDKGVIVIDPGFESLEVTDFLSDHAEKERLILLTHGHIDHIGGANALRERTGTPIAIGKNDAVMLEDNQRNLSAPFSIPYTSFFADRLLCGGEEFSVGDLKVTVLDTPGHTPGGVSFLINEELFCGDTLFCGSVGRTDFPFGDTQLLFQSIKRLYLLPEKTTVFAGHGPKTTIGAEKRGNPYVRDDG